MMFVTVFTCVLLKAILVTHNTREFGRVEGLQVEDWEAAGDSANIAADR